MTEPVPEQHDEAVRARMDRETAAAHEAAAEASETRTLTAHIRGNRRSLQLTGLIMVLFLIDFFWSSHTASTAAAGRARISAQAIAAEQRAITAEQHAIEAGCSFWEPLTSLAVTIVAPQNKPSKTGVQIIAGARTSYAGQCKPPDWPPIGPADPSLVKWAGYYHIPVTP